ncbi:hypothetical protein [uncultured Psychroserpens sp.]|uniref:hypothetical protein n=1 Tax=uncultured Psychroserpens sp. TaxID=255436 RepID=UPI0026085C7F|nr:hypothetical protein [uncultured Psychroserpens sp.]
MNFFDNNHYNIDISDFKVLDAGFDMLLIPKNYSKIHRKYLKASLLTVSMGNTSVDHILKKYSEEFDNSFIEESNSTEKLIDEILTYSKLHVNELNNRLKKLDLSNGGIKIIASHAIFLRLNASFKAVNYLIKFGVYFESFSILRLIFEQLAFSYSISISDGDPDNFKSPTKAISDLKKYLKYAGKLYGVLSKATHIDRSTINEYLKIKEDMNHVVLNSTDYSLKACNHLLLIIDALECIFEFVFFDYMQDIKYLNLENKEPIGKDRETAVNYRKFYKKIVEESNKTIG